MVKIIKKNISFIIIILMINSISASQNLSNMDRYIDSIVLYDDEILSNFYISIGVWMPHCLDQPSQYYSEIDITGNGAIFAAQTKNVDIDHEIGSINKTDYIESIENDGLLFTHNTENYILINNTHKIIRTNRIKLGIESGEIITKTPQIPRIDKYPSKNEDADNLLFRYVLALGRGYSRLISKYREVSIKNDGLLKVVGEGYLFSPQKGIWTLSVDQKNDYLIRRATFTLEGRENPVLDVSTIGLYSHYIKIAQSGSFNLDDYHISVELLNFENTFNKLVVDEVEEAVSIGPPDAFIMDFNLVNSDGMPLVIIGDPPEKLLDDLKKIDMQIKREDYLPFNRINDHNEHSEEENSSLKQVINSSGLENSENSHKDYLFYEIVSWVFFVVFFIFAIWGRYRIKKYRKGK